MKCNKAHLNDSTAYGYTVTVGPVGRVGLHRQLASAVGLVEPQRVPILVQIELAVELVAVGDDSLFDQGAGALPQDPVNK